MVAVRADLGVELRRYRGFDDAFAPHAHDAYVIGLVRSGSRALQCGGRSCTLVPGDLMVLNPGEAHACNAVGSDQLDYDGIAISVDAMVELVSREVEMPSRADRADAEPPSRSNAVQLPGPLVRSAEAAAVFGEVVSLIVADAPAGDVAEALCVLLSCIGMSDAYGAAERVGGGNGTAAGGRAAAELLEATATVGKRATADEMRLAAVFDDPPVLLREPSRLSDERIRQCDRAAQYMRAHIGEHMSVGDIAQKVGLSTYQLIRAFARRFGMTPGKCIQSLRVEKACELLALGATPSQVAQELGFSDQPHLTRLFRQRVGFTPGAYRAAVCNAQEIDDVRETCRTRTEGASRDVCSAWRGDGMRGSFGSSGEAGGSASSEAACAASSEAACAASVETAFCAQKGEG